MQGSLRHASEAHLLTLSGLPVKTGSDGVTDVRRSDLQDRLLLAASVLYALAGVTVLLVVLTGCGSKSSTDKAVAEIRVAGTERRLAIDVRDGATPSKMVADTRAWLDAMDGAGYSDAKKRQEIDSFSYIGDYCGRCGALLDDARP